MTDRGDRPKTKNSKVKLNESGETQSNINLKQYHHGNDMPDFDSKVGDFKTTSEFSDGLRGDGSPFPF